jgi:hypothetical protein
MSRDYDKFEWPAEEMLCRGPCSRGKMHGCVHLHLLSPFIRDPGPLGNVNISFDEISGHFQKSLKSDDRHLKIEQSF